MQLSTQSMAVVVLIVTLKFLVYFLVAQHMEVLMEYSERRYGLGVHLERGMFVAPWFTAHMQGKSRSFKAARRKTGVAGDAKITNYLTRPRQRWGMEVDRLYTPMIWEGTHWVGLCISLTEWTIYVFDPYPQGKTMEQVEELLEPVSTMLPYVAKKVYIDVNTKPWIYVR